ncbi:MAG TPA: aspartate-semialdehyde dehydrogenase, partial [Desulfuromonadales bacterium]|nr:aspartate-semialdehyde dehydrogenase [Desulfuromonadales bacterium]
TYSSVAVAAGAVCIDCSGAWGADPDVPLVVSDLNPQDIAGYSRKGIIASPSGAAIQLSAVLKPLHDHSPLSRVVVSMLQPVSDTGQRAVDELRIQSGELLNGRPAMNKVYPHQIAFNCLPHVGVFLPNGYTSEETSLIEETRKILGASSFRMTSTAVRVPVFYGQSTAVNVETEGKIDHMLARELLQNAAGLEVVDEPGSDVYPTPADVAGQDSVFVGRIREDESIENGLNLWVVSDNLRKGIGANVVQIAEILVATYL